MRFHELIGLYHHRFRYKQFHYHVRKPKYCRVSEHRFCQWNDYLSRNGGDIYSNTCERWNHSKLPMASKRFQCRIQSSELFNSLSRQWRCCCLSNDEHGFLSKSNNECKQRHIHDCKLKRCAYGSCIIRTGYLNLCRINGSLNRNT